MRVLFFLFSLQIAWAGEEKCSNLAIANIIGTTERTELHKFENRFVGEEVKILSDPRVIEMERTKAPDPERWARELALGTFFDSRFYGSAVIERKTKEYLGTMVVYRTKNKTAHLSYHFKSDKWGLGFATESLEEFMKFIAPKFNVKKFMAYAAPTNLGSQRVLEKLGFKAVSVEHEPPYFIWYERKVLN